MLLLQERRLEPSEGGKPEHETLIKCAARDEGLVPPLIMIISKDSMHQGCVLRLLCTDDLK